MVVKEGFDILGFSGRCSAAHFHMVVKEGFDILGFSGRCSAAHFHMVVKDYLIHLWMTLYLQYSMISLGSEGFKMLRSSIYWLRYSTFTYGSESKYVFAPSLMVQENTILQILI